jgi:adenine-specific DNA methylase
MIWDYAEGVPLEPKSGGWLPSLEWVALVFEQAVGVTPGHADQASAAGHPLPDAAADCVFTDPPYYDAVPYSDLSDFFYVWLRRSLPDAARALFAAQTTPKEDECIVDESKGKDRRYFERTMKRAMAEARRILNAAGVGVVVFAHKSTGGWEAKLQAIIDAGWTVTGSWPVDTERSNRLRAIGSAALASSVHLVCRPRSIQSVGDWREVMSELPNRIHEWMPRLGEEGVVGADAIFGCLCRAL